MARRQVTRACSHPSITWHSRRPIIVAFASDYRVRREFRQSRPDTLLIAIQVASCGLSRPSLTRICLILNGPRSAPVEHKTTIPESSSSELLLALLLAVQRVVLTRHALWTKFARFGRMAQGCEGQGEWKANTLKEVQLQPISNKYAT